MSPLRNQDNELIKLVAIDIDGTLLDPDGELGRENFEAVRGLRSRGLEVVLASGRSHHNMLPYHQVLELTSPLVSSQGAVVKDWDGTLRAACHLPFSTVRTLTEAGRQAGLSVLHYREDGVYLDQPNELTEHDSSRNHDPQRLIEDLLAAESAVNKLMWLGQPRVVSGLARQAEEIFSRRADVVCTDPGYLEFLPKGVNKATGLDLLCRECSLEPTQVAAFGDGNNDVEMLAWAGMGVAMDHATEAARSAARLVAPAGAPGSSLARALSMVFGL